MSKEEKYMRNINVDPTIEEYVLSFLKENQIVEFTGYTSYEIKDV